MFSFRLMHHEARAKALPSYLCCQHIIKVASGKKNENYLMMFAQFIKREDENGRSYELTLYCFAKCEVSDETIRHKSMFSSLSRRKYGWQ